MFLSLLLNAVTFFLILILLTSIALVLCIQRFKQSSNAITTKRNSAYLAVSIPPINRTTNPTTSELPEYVNIQPVPMVSSVISGETFRSSSPNCPSQPPIVDSIYPRTIASSADEKSRKHSLQKISKQFFNSTTHALFRTGRTSLQTSPKRATFTDSLILVDHENASIQQLYRCNDPIKRVPTKHIKRYASDSRCQSKIPTRGRSHSAEVQHSALRSLKKPATYVNIDDWQQEVQDNVTLPVQIQKYQNTCISHRPLCVHMSLDDLCDISTPKHQQWKKGTMNYNCSTIPSSQPTQHEYVNSILLLSRESTPDTEILSPMHKKTNDLELSSASINMEKHEYVNLPSSTSINTPFSQELFSAFDATISSDDETLEQDFLKHLVASADEKKTQDPEWTIPASNGDSHKQELSSLKQNEAHRLRDQFASSENSSEKHEYVNLTCLPSCQVDRSVEPCLTVDTLSNSSQHNDSLMDLDIADNIHDHEYAAKVPFCDVSIKIEEHPQTTSTNAIYTEEATKESKVTINSSLTLSEQSVDSDDENKTRDASSGDTHKQELSSQRQNEAHYLRDQIVSRENSSEKHDYVNLMCLPPCQFDTSIVHSVEPCLAVDTLSNSSQHNDSLMDLDIADNIHDHEYAAKVPFCDISIKIEEHPQTTSTNAIYTEEATKESTVTINSSLTLSEQSVDSDDENKTRDASSGDTHKQELSSQRQNEAHHLRDQIVSRENSSEKHDYVNLMCLPPCQFDTSIIHSVEPCLAVDTLSNSSQHNDSLMDLDIADNIHDHEYAAKVPFCDISIKIEEHPQTTSTNAIYTEKATKESTVTINSSLTLSEQSVDSDDENKTRDASSGDIHKQELSSQRQNEAHHLRDQIASTENTSEKYDYVNLMCLPPCQFDTSIIHSVEPCLAVDTLSNSLQHNDSLMDLDIADNIHDHEYAAKVPFCDISIKIEEHPQTTNTYVNFIKHATEKSAVTINSSPTSNKESTKDTEICFDQENFNKNEEPLLPSSNVMNTNEESSDGYGHIMKALKLL